MDHVYVEDVGSHVGEVVTLKGWLYNKRSSGGIHFLLLRDGTGIIQCVVQQKKVSEVHCVGPPQALLVLPQEGKLFAGRGVVALLQVFESKGVPLDPRHPPLELFRRHDFGVVSLRLDDLL